MRIQDSLEIIKSSFILSNELKQKSVKGVFLAGSPGIGKTVMSRNLAKQLGCEFYHVSAPELAPEQLSGIPEFVDAPNFNKYHTNSKNLKENVKATYWSIPEIIYNANRMAEENPKGVILMLDDIHETPMATISYFYQFLNERKISNYKLADNVFIIGALNNSEQAGFDGLPSPVKNRINLIEVSFDAETWLKDYAYDFHFHVKSFLQHNKESINEDERTDIEQFATARSWSDFNLLYNYMYENNNKMLMDNLQEIAKGFMSSKLAIEFEKHVIDIEKLDLIGLVKRKEIKDLKGAKTLDKIIYSNIVSYINEIEDASYLFSVLDYNFNNSKNVIGYFIGEIYAKTVIFDKTLEETGEPKITKGMAVFLAKFIGGDEGSEYLDKMKFTSNELKEIEKIEFDEELVDKILDAADVDFFS